MRYCLPFLLFTLVLSYSTLTEAQITGVSVETVYVDYGAVELYPFQGVTYCNYVHVTNPDDLLLMLGVFGGP